MESIYSKNIELIENGGWHFNNFYSPEKIKKKLNISTHRI